MWPEVQTDELQPLVYKNGPGRSRKVRIRECDEDCAKRRIPGVAYKCTKCGNFGHNVFSCKSLTQDPNALKRKVIEFCLCALCYFSALCWFDCNIILMIFLIRGNQRHPRLELSQSRRMLMCRQMLMCSQMLMCMQMLICMLMLMFIQMLMCKTMLMQVKLWTMLYLRIMQSILMQVKLNRVWLTQVRLRQDKLRENKRRRKTYYEDEKMVSERLKLKCFQKPIIG